MSRYAAQTSVNSDRSRAEIEKTLTRYGAGQFLYAWKPGMAVVGFTMNERQVKFLLPLPSSEDPEICETPTGKIRSDNAIEQAFEQAVRQRWRALALVIKAKLEAVESGITEFEDEFMAHIVLPDGSTMGEWARPQIESAYASGKMPEMLPQLEAPRG